MKLRYPVFFVLYADMKNKREIFSHNILNNKILCGI